MDFWEKMQQWEDLCIPEYGYSFVIADEPIDNPSVVFSQSTLVFPDCETCEIWLDKQIKILQENR